MKKLPFIILFFGIIFACTDKKKTVSEVPIPVESDGGIGDGAPSLDSLLQKEKEQLNDTLKNN